ncbi:MAG: hypothetical protein MHM6MM_008990, partial [Cercozoa sp. M6MM]
MWLLHTTYLVAVAAVSEEYFEAIGKLNSGASSQFALANPFASNVSPFLLSSVHSAADIQAALNRDATGLGDLEIGTEETARLWLHQSEAEKRSDDWSVEERDENVLLEQTGHLRRATLAMPTIYRFDECNGADLFSDAFASLDFAVINPAIQHCEINAMDIHHGMEMATRDYAYPVALWPVKHPDFEYRKVQVSVPRGGYSVSLAASPTPASGGCEVHTPTRKYLYGVYSALRKRAQREFTPLDIQGLSPGMYQLCLHHPDEKKAHGIGYVYLLPKLAPRNASNDHAVVVLAGHIPVYSMLMSYIRLRRHRP